MLIAHRDSYADRDLSEQFADFARRRARGEVCTLPTMLSKLDRRFYVRSTLREDHRFRIQNRPEGAQEKFDKLASSPFIFFRGTSLLYYRDQAGTDGHLPYVFAIGDVHPENFGVMPNEHGAPFFGIDDFDEAYFAPYSWDIKRGAVGFWLVGAERGFSKSTRRRIVRAFVDGYLHGLKSFAMDDREKWHQLRLDNSPPMIRKLLESACRSREEFLGEMIDMKTERFRATQRIVPQSKHVEKLQQAIDQYREENEIEAGGRVGHFKVKDVALKQGSGTASLGLERYFVLIDAEQPGSSEDVVLEVKQARRSSLHGLVPPSRQQTEGQAERIVRSHDVHLAGGDPYYGHTTIDGKSYLVRERSPYKADIDMDDLSKSEMCEYAGICGGIVAHAHARSDEDTGVTQHNAERAILESLDPQLFQADIADFAQQASRQICQDYKGFKKDHERGAFNFMRPE